MPLFEITYTDPESGDRKIVRQRFENSLNVRITAREWAEDYAYSLAGKNMDYQIEEIDKC